MNKMTKKIFIGMIPVQMLIALLPVVNGIIDGLIGTRLLGSDVMSVTGLFDPINCAANGILYLFSIGSSIVSGILIGKGELQRASRSFTMSLLLLAGIGLVFSVGLTAFSGPLAGMMYKNDVTAKLAEYMRGMGPGYLFYMICPILIIHLQLCGKGKIINYGILVMAYVNAFLDLLFISTFDLGIYGLGLATALANVIQAIMMMVMFFRKDSVIGFKFGKPDPEDRKGIWVFGYPRVIMFAAISLKSFLTNKIMLRLNGSAAMAVCTFQYVVVGVLETIANGLAGTVMALGSVAYGEEDSKEFRGIVHTGLRYGLVMSIIGTLFFVLLRVPLSMLYFGKEPAVQQEAAIMLMIAPCYIIFGVAYAILISVLQVLGKSKFISGSYIIEQAVALEFTYVFGRLWGLRGIWFMMPALKLVCLLVTAAYLLILMIKYDRKNIVQGLIPFPEGFGYNPEDLFTTTAYNMDELMASSEKVRTFCIEKGIDRKRAYEVSVCVEEMGRNIIQYGFPGRKNPIIIISLGIKNGEINLVIKDNCKHFDPEQWSNIHHPETKESNFGIRLTKSLSSEFHYKSGFGLNALNIRINANNTPIT